MTEVRVLGSRVDALVLAYRLETDAERLELFRRRAGESQALRTDVDLELYESDASETPLRFALRAPRRTATLDRFAFECQELRGLWDEQGAEGWTLELVPYAETLATRPLGEVLELCHRTADAFGHWVDARVRRLDLAADVGGWRLDDTPAEGFLTHAKSRHASFFDVVDDQRRIYRQCGEVTGFTVSPGGKLMSRVYDKTRELRLPGRESKRQIEWERWKAAGWTGNERADPVARVEFQARGEAIASYQARDPANLFERLDPIWRHLTERWLHLRVPGSATRRDRWALDDKWKLVQGVRFIHDDAPRAERVYVRQGAGLGQVLGAAASYAAAQGQLDAHPLGHLNERDYMKRLGVPQRRHVVAQLVNEVLGAATDVAIAELLEQRGAEEAGAYLLAKINGQVARFAALGVSAQRARRRAG